MAKEKLDADTRAYVAAHVIRDMVADCFHDETEATTEPAEVQAAGRTLAKYPCFVLRELRRVMGREKRIKYTD